MNIEQMRDALEEGNRRALTPKAENGDKVAAKAREKVFVAIDDMKQWEKADGKDITPAEIRRACKDLEKAQRILSEADHANDTEEYADEYDILKSVIADLQKEM